MEIEVGKLINMQGEEDKTFKQQLLSFFGFENQKC